MEEKEPKTDEAEVPAEEVEQKAENGDALAEEKPKEPAEKKPAEEPAEKTEEQPLEYKPPSPPKKRKRRRKQKNQMGVGGILDFARIRFGNGLREWEVEQDDHGRFTFDGEELSFDMWAQMNQTGEDGVFRAEKAYEFRSVLVHHLSLSQKTALLNSLRETPSL
ncbi:hypothetical protein M3Y99_00474300 [Aphelenchoides fujianensis]|nr:hypothetical protein M3Y99_00474300 [Aphelenchoides fujianensis]